MAGWGRRVAWIGAAVVAVCLAAGCNDAASVEAVCAKYCRCGITSPTLQRQCRTECEDDLMGVAIPDACLDCVSLEQCSAIDDGVCDDACQLNNLSLAPQRPPEESFDE